MASSTLGYASPAQAPMYTVSGAKDEEREYDIEKSSPKDEAGRSTVETRDASEPISPQGGGNGLFAKINHKLSAFGVEERGIERVYPHERSSQGPFSCFSM